MLSDTHPLTHRSMQMSSRVTTRNIGEIPNLIGETKSNSEYHRFLAEKYNLEPFGINNNQWAYEMCMRIEAKKQEG